MSTLYPEYRISPAAIHGAAMLNQLSTAAPAHARVLELGCGSGSMLLTHATAWPGSLAIGIDIDEQAVAAGQQLAQTGGLTNLELFAAGLGDLLAVDPGEFDYIIIHGLFALLGQPEREALLGWCQQRLATNGVIALRWRCQPGAREQQVLQHALGFHAAAASDPAARIGAARGMLSYMAMTLPDGDLKNQVLQAEKLDDIRLALTCLGETGETPYFVDFHQQLSAAGLHYVGDVVPQYELAEYYGEQTAQLHQLVANGGDRASAQQYLDFAVNRSERFSILSGQPVAPLLAPDVNRLTQLHWAGNFQRNVNAQGLPLRSHTSAAGLQLNTENPVTLQVLDLLGGAWPMSLSFEQLVFNARQPEQPEHTREQVLAALQDLFLNNLPGLYWSASPGPYNHAQNDKLTPVLPLAGDWPAEQQTLALVNLWGENVTLNLQEYCYLQQGFSATDEAAWQQFSALRAKGLLTGSPVAWKRALQHFLKQGHIDWLRTRLDTLLLLSAGPKQGGLLTTDVNTDPDSTGDDASIDAIYQQVNRLISAGKTREARHYTLTLLAQSPEDMHLLRCYSRACILTGAWEEALSALCRLMGYYFSSQDIYFDLARAFQKTLDHYHARKIVHGLLRLDEKNVDFWHSLATLSHARGDMALAEKCSREALRYQAVNPRHLAMMGIILSDNQKLEEARYFLEKALTFSPRDFDCFTSLLFVLTHDHTISPPLLLEKHRLYGQRVAEWAAEWGTVLPLTNAKDPERKLRIGMVSGDFRNHPVANFLTPFWFSIDRERFDLVGYSASSNKDAVTEQLRATAVLWREVAQLSDVELAKQINADGIDILMDVSGHTTYNRLPAFGLRPAPVQMTWIGYPGTTGLATMDYRILPATLANPPDLEAQFVENIIYVPLRKIFEPHPQSPAINPLPALSNGYFTFGSFNRPKKINDEVLRLWAAILQRCPQAKLLLGFMNDKQTIETMTRRLTHFGADPAQLLFKERVGLEAYLQQHHQVDLLLDAFPYTGGTTTNHGAWMGVPTLTLCGPTMAGRQGVEIMNGYGLQQFIADGEEDYLNKAIYWSQHPEELNAIRLSMRRRIPTENENGFRVAATFEKALRQAWRLYCAGEAPHTFQVEE